MNTGFDNGAAKGQAVELTSGKRKGDATMKIDMHTHAFADRIAGRALASLMSHMPAEYHTGFDGRLGTLVAQLRKHGFDRAVLCQIATKPEQFTPILEWSQAIRRGDFGEEAARMIVPLASVHPEDPARYSRIGEVAKAGFKGVKLHPYFQKFILDTPSLVDYCKAVRDAGLFIEIHVGYDIGFPFEDLCGPRRVANLIAKVPGLRFMVTHFGGWLDWDEVNEILIGAPVDLEISMSTGFCRDELLRDMLMRHPADRLYYGSDWPWSDYGKTLPHLQSLGIPADRMEALMGSNAARWLDFDRQGEH